MNAPSALFDSTTLARRRARFAATASAHDFLLTRVAEDFADRLEIVKRSFPVCANVMAHHGVVSRRLRAMPSVGSMIDCEGVGKLLAQCQPPALQASPEALPFADGSLDLAVSALGLQFVNDLPGALVQIQRALKPDGLLLAALLGGETLRELREAWLVAEEDVSGGASPRVAPFADVRELGGLLQRTGFALPVVDSDVVRVTYANPFAMMRDIQKMGASNMMVARRRVPVTRRLLLRAAEVYAERFGQPDGRVPATFEIITLTAWVPHDSQQKPLAPGSAKMRLADALNVNSTDRAAKG